MKKNILAKVQSLDLTPLRGAFTTIELIFMIVIVAILTSIGTALIPNYDLQNDTNFILMQIREKQKNALHYDTNNLTNNPWEQRVDNSKEYNLTCINLSEISLNNLEINATNPSKYKIKSVINPQKTLCFDFLGRPYENGEARLLLQALDINVTKNGKTKTISVFPMSGYAKIQ